MDLKSLSHISDSSSTSKLEDKINEIDRRRKVLNKIVKKAGGFIHELNVGNFVLRVPDRESALLVRREVKKLDFVEDALLHKQKTGYIVTIAQVDNDELWRVGNLDYVKVGRKLPPLRWITTDDF